MFHNVALILRWRAAKNLWYNLPLPGLRSHIYNYWAFWSETTQLAPTLVFSLSKEINFSNFFQKCGSTKVEMAWSYTIRQVWRPILDFLFRDLFEKQCHNILEIGPCSPSETLTSFNFKILLWTQAIHIITWLRVFLCVLSRLGLLFRSGLLSVKSSKL